jgi:hypothetical protein
LWIGRWLAGINSIGSTRQRSIRIISKGGGRRLGSFWMSGRERRRWMICGEGFIVMGLEDV